MKSCFISRLGGIGDILHASHLPRIIKEHLGVEYLVFETNYYGMHVLNGNPFIDRLDFIDVTKMTHNRMVKNLENAKHEYDLVFDLSNTIEKMYCVNENDYRYYMSQEWRRNNLGKTSYYDVMTHAVGLSCYGERGKLYYPEENHEHARAWVEKFKKEKGADFLILLNLSGSTLHKNFVQAKEVSERILDEHRDAFIILTGDDYCQPQVFENERVISRVGKDGWNFPTVALRCKYMDLTISLESGLPLIAHSWDAPCLQLLTAASPENHCKYAKNAYWIQSPVQCSPCHKNPRSYFGCPVKEKMPECVYFDVDEIARKVTEIRNECRVLSA